MADRAKLIADCLALIAHKNTPEGEKESARRLLDRLQRAATEAGEDTRTSAEWSGYYRLPEREFGAKYRGYVPLPELTKLIRADIRLARDLGKAKSAPGAVKVADPIGDAPAGMKFFVRHANHLSIFITIKGVPADWWTTEDYPYPHVAPGPKLKALAAALKAVMWAYNYDGSDAQVDYFDRGFYQRVIADGHGENAYLRDV